MGQENDKAEVLKLQKEVNYHNYRYHVLDDPIISDYEYDRLLQRLQQLEKLYPELVTPDSPTQRSGSRPLDKFLKVIHPAPILSLANAFNKNDLTAWYDRICKLDQRVEKSGFVMEPKIDGLTVVLHYENGFFVQGATRGDGVIGEDVTENLKTVRALPLKIPIDDADIRIPERLVVRGEVYIRIKDFQALNLKLLEGGEKTYQNPRNTAAGSLRQLDPGMTSSRPLNLLTYAIVESSEEVVSTQWDTLNYLRKAGFPVSLLSELKNSFADVLEDVDSWMDRRDSIPFEVDGVVIKLNDLEVANWLGISGKDPRGAIALKYPAREISTILINIGVNIGRTGVLTPYAILEPVELGGVIVKQATLHNFDYIHEKDIRIGDRVLIKRAGDVIPYVIGPMIDARTGKEKVFEIPSSCPSCGQAVERIPGEVALYCVNASCPAQLVRVIEHFVSKGAMDVDGLGIKIVEQLVESGQIKDVADLYLLSKAQLLTLEGFAGKKADNLINSITSSKAQPLPRFINALGIRGVGEVASADLASYFGSMKNFIKAGVEDFLHIGGIGPNIALSIKEWLDRSANRELLAKFKKIGIWPENKIQEKGGNSLEDLIFVVTGTLPTLSRDDAKAVIERNGGKTTDSVSRNTNYLLLGENPGSKLDKAKELGIPVIGEKELLDLIKSRSG